MSISVTKKSKHASVGFVYKLGRGWQSLHYDWNQYNKIFFYFYISWCSCKDRSNSVISSMTSMKFLLFNESQFSWPFKWKNDDGNNSFQYFEVGLWFFIFFWSCWSTVFLFDFLVTNATLPSCISCCLHDFPEIWVHLYSQKAYRL